jgi:SHS2 domain-containing protein
MSKKKFKFLEHTADVKFQAFGKTLEECFKNSAIALKKTIFEDKTKEKKEMKIEVKGKDLESLLYNFLEEILYFLEADNFLLNKIKSIKIDKKEKKLLAVVVGDKASSYNFTNPVKAITYNEMFVKQQKQGKSWIAQVVLDV